MFPPQGSATQYRTYLNVLCQSLNIFFAMFSPINQIESDQVEAITATSIQILKYYPKEFVSASRPRHV